LTGVNVLDQPDVTLILDRDAVIRDVTVSNTISGEVVHPWLGLPWIDTVAESGVERVRQSLTDARSDGLSAFRQIPQRFPSGLELPIEYTTVQLGESGGLIAIGRNLQSSSDLQSRLIAAQQAMERDYWKLREVETRYRLLFDASNEAVLVLTSDDLRVVEANPSAIRALGLTRGWEFVNELAPRERESFRAMLVRVRESGRAPGGVFHIGADQKPWILKASLMSDEAAAVYMLQLMPLEAESDAVLSSEVAAVLGLVQNLPDGFIVIDRDGVVHNANRAFLDMLQVSADSAVVGLRLDRWLRRASDDFKALLTGLRQHGSVRLFRTTLRGERGAGVEVEISAGGEAHHNPAFIGMVVRDIGRRIAPPAAPHSAQPALPALESSGNAPLKQLVQAAVSVVERHYVEAALQITEGNRTAAAERLGLSRQSLYAKLSRYGLESGIGAKS
jgi:transcriptional regulator PpsR